MNIFTKDDYRKIQAWLKANSIKDSDLTSVNDTIPEEDTLVLVQKINGVLSNVKISIKNLINSTLSKVIINTIIANAVKVNNTLTVTASNVKIDNEKGTTLQDIIDWTETIEKAAKGWNIEYQVPSIDEPTVRAKYVLKDSKGVPKGDVIKVYKDSAITNVYLGTTKDTCNENTGEVTKEPVQNNNEALSIVYRLDTGKYSLVNVPIGIFTREAEFDKYRGLGITENGQVFIKLASDVESSNYLHFNDNGELSADGIENRILRDLGTIINSVAGDSTMWGQYKKEEGTKDSPINESSRWGQYKQAEAKRSELLNTVSSKINTLKNKIDSLALGAFYGYFPDSESLPVDITTSGYAYVGLDNPYEIWNFNGESWSDSGTSIDMSDADEEDITRNIDGKLQFKDKEYGDGMGHVILRKNKSFAEQVIKTNTIYEIRYDFDLNGEEITIPESCILDFQGGSLSNGTIIGNNTNIKTINILNDWSVKSKGNFIYSAILYCSVIELYRNKNVTFPLGGFITFTKGFYGEPVENITYQVIEKYNSDGYSININDNILKPSFNNGNIILNIRSVGSINSWSHSNTLVSDWFETVEDARKFYMDDEIEFVDNLGYVGIKKAINNNPNYPVYIPYGSYKINKTLRLKDSSIIKGTGSIYVYEKVNAFDCSNLSNIIIDGIKINSSFIVYEETGSENTKDAIYAYHCTTNKFTNISIFGFNRGIYYGENSWISTCENIEFRFCNYGIYADGEFNRSIINNVIATYCKTALYLGQGRGITVDKALIELNDNGIKVSNTFDGQIINSYFERNTGFDVQIYWGQKVVKKIDISNCTFFCLYNITEPKSFIECHGSIDTEIYISKNRFYTYIPENEVLQTQIYGVCKYSADTKANIFLDDTNIVEGITDLTKPFQGVYNTQNSFDTLNNTPYFVNIDTANNSIDLTKYIKQGIYIFRCYISSSYSSNIKVILPSSKSQFYKNRLRNITIIPVIDKNYTGYINIDKLYYGSIYSNKFIEVSPYEENNGYISYLNNSFKEFSSNDVENIPKNYGNQGALIIDNSQFNRILTQYGEVLTTADGFMYCKKHGHISDMPIMNTPTKREMQQGYIFFDDENHKPYWYDNEFWRTSDGAHYNAKRSGTYSEKPESWKIYIGFEYFCTDRQTTEGSTNGIMIYYKGNSVWVDALGRIVE